MGYRSAAFLVVVVHLGFVAFVLTGGYLAWRWRRLLALHLLAVATSAYLAVSGTECPLTDLEKWLRRRAGDEAYAGGFIAHYLVEPVRPAGITPGLRTGLRVFTVTAVVAAYAGLLLLHARQRERAHGRSPQLSA